MKFTCFFLLFNIISTEILLLSDIHLNLLYSSNMPVSVYCQDFNTPSMTDSDMGRFGCDININMLKKVLNEAKLSVPDPELIIVTGDFLSHAITHERSPISISERRNFQEYTFRIINKLLSDLFPSVAVLPALGNNDLVFHYKLPKKEELAVEIQKVSKFFNFNSTFKKCLTCLNANYLEIFEKGLYYSYLHNGVTFISLNTFFMSSSLTVSDNYVDSLMDEQVAFLEEELQKATNSVLFAHFPINYNIEKSSLNRNIREKYADALYKVINRFSSKITLIVYGHIHRFDLGVVMTENRKIPTIMLPAVTPTDMSNPAYGILKLGAKIEEFTLMAVEMNTKANLKRKKLVFSLKELVGSELSESAVYEYLLKKEVDVAYMQMAMGRRDKDVMRDFSNIVVKDEDFWKVRCAALFLEKTKIEECFTWN